MCFPTVKNFENRLRFDKVTDSLKVGTFLRDSVHLVSENKRPPCRNSTSGFDFTFVSPSSCHSASAYQITSKSDHSRHSYDVILIFEDCGHGIAILLPVSFFVTSPIWEGRSLPAYQISARYLNHGWDIATFCFWKQTSAMLEFYFRFRFSYDLIFIF